MRRRRHIGMKEYIEVRIEQLQEDMKKARDPYDKQWYNRIINELSWARDPDINCYMEKYGEAE